MSAKRMTSAALLGVIAALTIVVIGCSSPPAATKPKSAPVSKVSSSSSSSNTGGSKVVDDHIVTYSQGDLTGLLPPAQPVQIIHRGNPNLKRVAITIDDGWNPDMRILTLLKAWKIQFTTFLIGGRGVAETHPDFVRAIQEAGGEVCNHTYSHYIMKDQTEAGESRHHDCQDVITHITMRCIRTCASAAGIGPNTALWAAQEGFWTIDWTIDSLDTRTGITPNVQMQHDTQGARTGCYHPLPLGRIPHLRGDGARNPGDAAARLRGHVALACAGRDALRS